MKKRQKTKIALAIIDILESKRKKQKSSGWMAFTIDDIAQHLPNTNAEIETVLEAMNRTGLGGVSLRNNQWAYC
jgi:hypothetical protein